MAVKKPTKPRKFKQARKDAKSAAKSTFSGKAQARLKDPSLRLTADDKLALDEMKKTAKAELGDKAYLSKSEYEAQQRKAREAFREKMRAEFGEYGGKKASSTDVKVTDRRTPSEKAASKKSALKEVKKNTKKFVAKGSSEVMDTPLGSRRLEQMKKAGISEADAKKVLDTNKPAYKKTIKGGKSTKTFGQVSKAVADATKKPATKGYSAGKSLATEAGKARYDELIKQGVKPKSAMNKALFFESKKAPSKPATELPKMTTEQMKAQNKKALDGLKKDIEAVKQGTKKTASKTVKKKVTASATKKAAGKSVASIVGSAAKNAAIESVKFAGPGKFLKGAALIKGAIGASKAVRVGKAVKTAKGIKKVGAANTARKAVNAEKAAKVAAQGRKGKVKKFAKTAAGLAAIGMIPTPGSGKANRQMTKPTPSNKPVARDRGPAQQSPGQRLAIDKANAINAGGATTSYTVKKGDTLSAIAKNAGTTLADIRKANPKLMTDAKYKQGNAIWSGTKVKLPKKK